MAFLESLFGRAWEGLTGWVPVLRALDEVADMPPVADVTGLRSLSGKTTYRPSDLVSAPEVMVVQMAGLVRQLRPIRVGADQLLVLPSFGDGVLGDEACAYGASLQLPFDTVFLDFCDERGNPAALPQRFFDERIGVVEAQSVLYGAVLTRLPPDWSADMALLDAGVLVVIPFGCALKIGDQAATPRHVDGRLPPAAPLGYVQFGGRGVGLDSNPTQPTVVIGDMRLESRSAGVRPTLGIIHLMPLGHKVFAGVGTAHVVEPTLAAMTAGLLEQRLGPAVIPSPSAIHTAAEAEAQIVAYQVDMTLRAMYLLESANVELTDAPVSRQVRRAVERSNKKVGIAQVIQIRRSRHRSRTASDGGGREYSHSFERAGGYWHITKGSHVENPSDPATVKPCPEWRTKHPHSEICRREVHGFAFVDAGPDKPFVPKSRKLKGA